MLARRFAFVALTLCAAAACFSSSNDDGCGFGHLLDGYGRALVEAGFGDVGGSWLWSGQDGSSSPCRADLLRASCACNAQPVCVGRFSEFADRDLYYWECPDGAVDATCERDADTDADSTIDALDP